MSRRHIRYFRPFNRRFGPVFELWSMGLTTHFKDTHTRFCYPTSSSAGQMKKRITADGEWAMRTDKAILLSVFSDWLAAGDVGGDGGSTKENKAALCTQKPTNSPLFRDWEWSHAWLNALTRWHLASAELISDAQFHNTANQHCLTRFTSTLKCQLSS